MCTQLLMSSQIYFAFINLWIFHISFFFYLSYSICIHMSLRNIKNLPIQCTLHIQMEQMRLEKISGGEKKKNLFSGNKSPSNNASSLLLLWTSIRFASKQRRETLPGITICMHESSIMWECTYWFLLTFNWSLLHEHP